MVAKKKATEVVRRLVPEEINNDTRLTDDGPSVQLIGRGAYSICMLENLLKEAVDVRSYLVQDMPNTIIKPNSLVSVTNFHDYDSLARNIGGYDYSVIFNLDMKILPEHLNEDLLNIHPSLLPEFSGFQDPILEQVKRDREYGGVTVHVVNEDIDKGPIYGQRKFKLEPWPDSKDFSHEDIDKIYAETVIPKSADFLYGLINRLYDGELHPEDQEEFYERDIFSYK